MQSNRIQEGNETAKLASVVQIDEQKIQDHLGQVVRGTVEQTLNALLEAEADALCGARRYERAGDPSILKQTIIYKP